MNFLDAQCQSGPFVQERFGLCDNTSRPIAYADSESEENWIATVSNPERKAVIFTAIDKCVISDMEQPGRGRCDCMLTTEKQLYLVELKERNGSAWKNHAIEQLESTIQFLRATHGEDYLNSFSPKKAFVCNRKKKPFVTIETDRKQYFFRTYKFKLDIQTTVLIV
ncbi:hypothetical protein SOP89_07605 [Pseudomonas siliginis]|nr:MULTISPECIES: hypothetical protein [Pseudomonas]AMT89497.1 hypothetical protein AYO71_18880 [Pseudomonas koreensis]MBB4054567.1 hypothetical protein [Pseudomonas koreensis]MEB2651236.1 hypothetical protein [Pseudomonas siliginis]TSB49190.1 hypothetical protein FEE99_26490 [Pseudomonas sp. ef1]UST72427.1 hypothetical protein NF675_15565 [Pseudomonas siliginis]